MKSYVNRFAGATLALAVLVGVALSPSGCVADSVDAAAAIDPSALLSFGREFLYNTTVAVQIEQRPGSGPWIQSADDDVETANDASTRSQPSDSDTVSIPPLSNTDDSPKPRTTAIPLDFGNRDSEGGVGQSPNVKELDTRMKEFRTWMESNGANFGSLEIQQVYPGILGVVASKPIKTGEQQFSVPPSLVMNRATALKSDVVPLIKLFLSSTVKSIPIPHTAGVPPTEDAPKWPLDDDVIIIAFLHFEAFFKENSFWSPYLRLLPTEFPTHPLYYNAEELKLLETNQQLLTLFNGNVRRLSILIRVMLHYVILPNPQVYGLDSPAARRQWEQSIKWAFVIYYTRVYGPRYKGDGRALVPLSDLLNHRNGAPPLDFIPKRNNGTIVGVDVYRSLSERDYLPGEEVFAGYDVPSHVKCEEHFVMGYGFLNRDPSHINDCLDVSVSLSEPNDSLGHLRNTALKFHYDHEKKNGRNPTLYESKRREPIPVSLIRHLRLAELSQSDIGHYERALKNEVVSVMNELKVVRVLRKAAKGFRVDRLNRIEAIYAKRLLSRDRATWTQNQRNIMDLFAGQLRQCDTLEAAADRLWLNLIDSGHTESYGEVSVTASVIRQGQAEKYAGNVPRK